MIRLNSIVRNAAFMKWFTMFFICIFVLTPGLSFSFGATGHRIVGQIAQNHLSPKAKEEIAKIIGPQTLARVSTWADEIRSNPAWRKAAPWHYVTVEDEQTIDEALANSEENVIEAIERFANVLRDASASRENKAEALKFIVHFVGDIHQPLHVGRGADRGGNSIKAEWFGDSSNLHRIWDSEMIDHEQLSFTEFASFIDHASQEEIEAWQKSGPKDWARESKDYRGKVYNFGSQRNPEKTYLGYKYIYKHNKFLKQRLLQAGVRLAGLFNEIFG